MAGTKAAVDNTIALMQTLADAKSVLADNLMNRYVHGEHETFFSTIPMLLSIADMNGYLVSVNEPEWVERLGYTAQDLRGQQFFDLIYPPDIQKTREMYQYVKDGGKCENWPNRYIPKWGGVVEVHWFSKLTNDKKFIISAAYIK